MSINKESIISKDGISYLVPFILVTSCFALWGFANDITNPMVKAFSKSCGRDLPYEFAPRREGDLPAFWADPAYAKEQLGWVAERGILVQGGCTDGARTLCHWSPIVPACLLDRHVLSLPGGILHPDLRTVVPGNIV